MFFASLKRLKPKSPVRKRTTLPTPLAYRFSLEQNLGGRLVQTAALKMMMIYCPPVLPALPELTPVPDEDVLPADPPELLVPVSESLAAPFNGEVDDDEPDPPAALLEGLGFVPVVDEGNEFMPADPSFTPSMPPAEEVPVVPDMPLEGKSLDEELPDEDDPDPDDEPDEPGVSTPPKEDVPDVPLLLVDGNCEELVPVVSEGPGTLADVPDESMPDDDVPAVPDAPALSVFPFAPFMDDESPCDDMPTLEESPDELIPDDEPAIPPLVPDVLHAVALIRHAAQAKGMIHFFLVAMTAPSR